MAYSLPDLPYDYDALEPTIDEKTMRIHHTKHHQGYTAKGNAALEGHELTGQPIEEELRRINDIPEDKRQAVINNSGGYTHHTMRCTSLSPNGGREPSRNLH